MRSIAEELEPIADPLDAAEIVVERLQAGLAPRSIWDGLVLAGAAAAHGPANHHAVTAIPALRDAFLLASSRRVRLLMLLQGASYLPPMGHAEGMPEERFLELEPGPFSLDEVFATLGREGVERALGYLASGGDPQAYARRHAEIMRTRAFDEQHYKIPDATFVEADRLPAPWKPHLLAISRIWAPTSNDETNLAWRLVMES